jgi:hypothetical protein
VDRTGILYVTRAVGCTGRDSHLNEAPMVYIQLNISLVRYRWRVQQGRNYSDSGILRFAVCVYSVLLLGDIS